MTKDNDSLTHSVKMHNGKFVLRCNGHLCDKDGERVKCKTCGSADCLEMMGGC